MSGRHHKRKWQFTTQSTTSSTRNPHLSLNWIAQYHDRKRSRMSNVTQPVAHATAMDVHDGETEAGSGLPIAKYKGIPPHVYNNNFTVRLTYADTYTKTIAYNDAKSHCWASTSLYDPDVTNAGHQPLGRDLWAGMYEYYSVLACDYEIVVYNATSDNIDYSASGTHASRPDAALITFLATTNASDLENGDSIYPIAEQKNAHTLFLPPQDTVTFTGTLTPGDFLVDAKDADDDKTWTAIGSNPTVGRFFGINCCTALPGGLTGQSEVNYLTLQVFAKLHYTVQFTQVPQAIRTSPS